MLRMFSLIVLLVLLLSPLACGAESLGGVPQVVDTDTSGAKPIIEQPSQTLHPTPEPDKNGRDLAAEVDSQQRLNELQRELLDTRGEFLDARTKNVDWWLTATAVFLTLLGIVAVIAGYLSFKRFGEIEAEARQNVAASKEHAEEAERLVEEIRASKAAAKAQLEELTAEGASQKPQEAARTVASVQRDPTASVIDRAIAATVLLQQQGNIEGAVEKWHSIANIAEDRQLQARAWFSVGYLLSDKSDKELEAKIDAYTKAIKLNPAYTAAYNNRGRANRKLGRYEEAIADYNRAIELDPTYARAYNNRGFAKICLGRPKDALADIDRAIDLNPAYARAYDSRGFAKEKLGRYEEAIAAYNRAIELDPAYALAYNNRGFAKGKLGRYEEAIAAYNRAIELDPTYALAYNNRGFTKGKLGRTKEAREDYQRALTLAQESGDEDLVATVKRSLSRLGN